MDRIAWFRRAALACAVAVAAFLTSHPTDAQIAAPGSPAVVMAPAARPPAAPATPATPNCVIPPDFARFDRPLPRTQRRLLAGQPMKIVAIGSSSTFGAGASKPYNSYPSRLAAELSREFVDHDIKVINRGVNGDTAVDMLARFERGVIAEKPDLVLWQVGTNSLLRGDPIAPHRSLLHGGILRLKAINADVVLIDPQYAPRVLARPNHDQMLDLLKQTARVEAVNLFQRFALMRHWHEVERMAFEAFLSPDELHLNDFSYGCIARALGGAIAEALTRPVLSATAPAGKARN
ncbi:MAG: SGNH/GDSL hydrolase family protein [Xanthobacteraceae bacterium]|nr:SGNH/GDSL hydrolase family protein [Xanthobacteraceae bacterium]